MIYVEKTAKLIEAKQFDGSLKSAHAIKNWIAFHDSSREVYYDMDYNIVRIKGTNLEDTVRIKEFEYVYFIDGEPSVLFVEDKDFFENSFKQVNR